MTKAKQQSNISQQKSHDNSSNDKDLSFKNGSDKDKAKIPIAPNKHSDFDSSISSNELYQLIREQIRHEDELVNHRLNWLLASQAFLFTALAVLITNAIPTNYIDATIAIWLPFGIALTGILLNLSSFVGLRAAYKSLKALREYWFKWEEKGHAQGFPQLTWTGNWYDKAITTASSTPIIISTIWFVIAWAVMPIKGIFSLTIILVFYVVIVLSMILSTIRN